MSYEFGHCRVEELPELVQLTNQVFRANRPGDMGSEYPLVFDPRNVENLLVARSEGRIVAHVGLCLRDATLLGAPIRVASIGAVATDPAHRGHGFATQLMANARAQAAREGTSLMLISGLRGLYRRLGYVQVGDFRSYLISAGPSDPTLTVAELGQDLAAIVQLHQREPVRFLRSRDDWGRLLAAGMLMNHAADLLLIREGGVPVAYAGVQRPDQPQDPSRPVLVKELAGSREALARALPGIAARYHAPAVEVITSGSDTSWLGAAASRGWSGTPLPFPGTLCIIDGPRFLRAIAPILSERSGDALRIEPRGEVARVVVGGETVVLETLSQLTALLFGGESADARAVPELPPAVREAVDEALPLPLLWYGYNYV